MHAQQIHATQLPGVHLLLQQRQQLPRRHEAHVGPVAAIVGLHVVVVVGPAQSLDKPRRRALRVCGTRRRVSDCDGLLVQRAVAHRAAVTHAVKAPVELRQLLGHGRPADHAQAALGRRRRRACRGLVLVLGAAQGSDERARARPQVNVWRAHVLLHKAHFAGGAKKSSIRVIALPVARRVQLHLQPLTRRGKSGSCN
jgi:hypothetical protein